MYFKRRAISWLGIFLLPLVGLAQVNGVEFGKNRVQHKKFKWKFYQSANFNAYVSQGGVELGKIRHSTGGGGIIRH